MTFFFFVFWWRGDFVSKTVDLGVHVCISRYLVRSTGTVPGIYIQGITRYSAVRATVPGTSIYSRSTVP